ncbi:30S ribosomal protein S20 [Neorickettsia sp. 179522]|uniref:30S ribosomal protein S20 n=1 Tax=Neorickettsia sp. 179522 TaxID=1714371 RepID=UPI0007927954|nr:30S ribosomal protein S20 [Neorickettsia sp. 179522]KYH12754.1 30S ribosomal protein S20 [Neorickettsia sp. 179522]
MANTASARKMVRKIKRRTLINKMRMSRIKTFVRKVRQAIAVGPKSAAAEALRVAQPEIHRGVTKGVLHKNRAARIVSRLSGHIKKMA